MYFTGTYPAYQILNLHMDILINVGQLTRNLLCLDLGSLKIPTTNFRGVDSFLNPGRAGSIVRGIICPPGLNRVYWSVKFWGGERCAFSPSPPPPLATPLNLLKCPCQASRHITPLNPPFLHTTNTLDKKQYKMAENWDKIILKNRVSFLRIQVI